MKQKKLRSEKKDEKKDDKNDDKKSNEKTGLPLLHEYRLFENDDKLKATSVRADRVHELDEGPGKKFLSFEANPTVDNMRRYMVVVEDCMEYAAFFQCCIIAEEDSRRLVIEKLIFHQANFRAYQAVTKAISERCKRWKTNLAVAMPSAND